MQLRLIRFDLLILLLVSLIHVEALEKLSRVAALAPRPVAMPFQQVASSSWVNDEKVFGSPDMSGFLAHMGPESRGTHRRRDTRKGGGGKTVTKTNTSSPSNSATLLAEKLAQDALRSKEMQDTIKELTSLKGENKKHHEITTEAEQASQPSATTHSTTHAAKTTTKSKGRGRHKGQQNRQHNTHRKQGRKQRLPKRRLKRHRSKKEFSKTARKTKSRKSVSRGRRRGLKGKYSSEKLVTCRRKRGDQVSKTRKNSEENLEPLLTSDQHSVEELPNFESTHRKYKQIAVNHQNEKKTDPVHRKRSHIIAQLMLTTTPDPNKKKPGDQGVEYSEYYSDNDNVLMPDIGASSKIEEAARTVTGGKVRSVRNAANEDPLDQEYYDLSNELEDDAERLKRNDQKFVRVMQEPSNSMEYVDNTYGPAQANGIARNEKIPDYLLNYNYVFDQGAQRQGDANQVLNNPSAEIVPLRQPTSNQFSPDPFHMVNKNPAMIGSPQNKASSNIIPSMSTRLNANPMMNNVQQLAPGRPSAFGNAVASQLPRPRITGGNLPYYSVNKILASHSTNLLTTPVVVSTSTSPGKPINNLSDVRVNVPDSKKLLKLYVATSGAPSSSPSDFNPTPSYDSFGANSRIFGSESPGRATSVSPASPRASLVTSLPADISSASLDSPKLFSGLRDIRPELGAPAVSHFSDDDEAENTQGPDQIEPIASRNIDVESSTVKKGKQKGPTSKKTSVPTSTTVSEMHEAKEHASSKATKGVDYNLLPMMTCQTSNTTASSTSKPENTTVIANTTVTAITTVTANATVIANATAIANKTVTVNETKAIANEILNEIIDEIEELKLENPKDEQREGLPCRLTGSWVTARAGVRIDMNVTNHTVHVSLDHLTSPTTTDALLNVTWNVTGFAPFKRGGPFTLLATNNHTKTLAVFIGACKVCQGIDTIEGSWIVSHEPRDCRDFQMSTNVFNEIFRRTRLYSAIKDKQSKHETPESSTSATSASSSTSESTSTAQAVSDHSEKSHNESLIFNAVE